MLDSMRGYAATVTLSADKAPRIPRPQLRGVLAESDRYRRTQASLERQKAAASSYEPWQVELLSLARLWIVRADWEKADSRARLAARRAREQATRRAKRTGGPPPPKATAGRPPMALSSRLVIAGVESQRGFGVTFDQVASFLVQEIAPRLPNDLRKKFLGGKASVGRQIAKISARLRRASSRLKPQK